MFELKVTDRQISVLIDALDLYSRIGIGQVEEVAEVLRKLYPDHCKYDDRKLLADFKMKVFEHGINGSWGVCNEQVHDNCQVAYDIEKVLQKAIASKYNHHSTSVWHDGPMLHLGSEPIAKIKDMESKDGQLTIDKESKTNS